jgi:hypothetical protein
VADPVPAQEFGEERHAMAIGQMEGVRVVAGETLDQREAAQLSTLLNAIDCSCSPLAPVQREGEEAFLALPKAVEPRYPLAQCASFAIDRLSSPHHDPGVCTLGEELVQLRESVGIQFIVVMEE